MGKGITIKLNAESARAVNLSLKTYEIRITRAIKDALDDVAAGVQNLARMGHPRIAKVTGKLKRSVELRGRQRRDRLRSLTGRAGQFTGMMRYLTVTGATTQSIFIRRARQTISGYSAEVFSGMPHATELEFGTAKRRAFPFMRPAAIQMEKPGREHLRRAIARVLA